MQYDLKALSREWFESVWNQRDESAIMRLASPDVKYQGLGEDGQIASGLDQLLRFRRSILTAFPDLAIQVQDVIAENDKTAIRVTFTGTHTGEGIGVPPSNRRFIATAIVMLRWSGGKIVEAWNEFDAAGMMKQLQAPAAKLRA